MVVHSLVLYSWFCLIRFSSLHFFMFRCSGHVKVSISLSTRLMKTEEVVQECSGACTCLVPYDPLFPFPVGVG